MRNASIQNEREISLVEVVKPVHETLICSGASDSEGEAPSTQTFPSPGVDASGDAGFTVNSATIESDFANDAGTHFKPVHEAQSDGELVLSIGQEWSSPSEVHFDSTADISVTQLVDVENTDTNGWQNESNSSSVVIQATRMPLSPRQQFATLFSKETRRTPLPISRATREHQGHRSFSEVSSMASFKEASDGAIHAQFPSEQLTPFLRLKANRNTRMPVLKIRSDLPSVPLLQFRKNDRARQDRILMQEPTKHGSSA